MQPERRFCPVCGGELLDRTLHCPTCGAQFLGGGSESDRFSIPHSGSSSLYKILLVSLVAVALIVASVTVVIPYAFPSRAGPPPIWHSFEGVFSSSGAPSASINSLLASTNCSLSRVQNIANGVGSIVEIDPTAPVVCSFQGQTYQGIIGTDCNLSPTGAIPSINGSQVPYDGCVLSYAPLSYVFSGLFNTTSRATNGSIAVYSNQAVIANITTTSNWKNYRCSMASDNETKTNGPLLCFYLGIPYSTTNFATSCSSNVAVQTNGISIPQGGCVLQRSEPRS